VTILAASTFVGVRAFGTETPAHFSPPSGWTQVGSFLNLPTFEGPSSHKEMVSIIEDPSMKNQTPSWDDSTLIDDMEKGSEVPRTLAGITQWKVDHVSREALSSGQRVAVTGSYLNVVKKRVYFEEWEYFLPEGYGQITYTQLMDSSAPTADEENQIHDVMKRYRPFGG